MKAEASLHRERGKGSAIHDVADFSPGTVPGPVGVDGAGKDIDSPDPKYYTADFPRRIGPNRVVNRR